MTAMIAAAIAEALSEVTERPVTAIDTNARLDKDYDLDSYMFVQFLLSLEDKIPGLRFDPEQIGQAGFNSMASLVDHIAARVAPAEAVLNA